MSDHTDSVSFSAEGENAIESMGDMLTAFESARDGDVVQIDVTMHLDTTPDDEQATFDAMPASDEDSATDGSHTNTPTANGDEPATNGSSPGDGSDSDGDELAGVAARPPEYPDEPVPRRQAIDPSDIDLYGEVDADWLRVPHTLSHGVLVVLQTLATSQSRPPNRKDVAKRFSQAWFSVPEKAVGTAMSTLGQNGLVSKTADESSTQCRKAYQINAPGSANLAALPAYNAHWTKVYGNFANGSSESYPEPEFGESTS